MNLELSIRKAYRYLWYVWYHFFRGMNHLGHDVSFCFQLTMNAPQCIAIGNNVVLQEGTRLNIEEERIGQKIIIGDGTSFERRCTVSAAKQIIIGKNVLFGPNVFVADHLHAYEDITKPIKDQGITKVLPVAIGDDSWLGINVVVMPGVSIGKHCIIGSNSVVTKSIPDYTVACGVPARCIKKFDSKKQKWISSS